MLRSVDVLEVLDCKLTILRIPSLRQGEGKEEEEEEEEEEDEEEEGDEGEKEERRERKKKRSVGYEN